MAYDEQLADRIRERLAYLTNVEEKSMMGGLTFMYNGKMCIGVIKDEMMCRIDPDTAENELQRPGWRPMDFTGQPMKGYIIVNETGMKTGKDFEFWTGLALAFNPKAKASKKSK